MPDEGAVRRVQVRVRGLVQGVGFRPHVYRTARRLGMAGFVLNDADGVLIEAEGRGTAAFLEALEADRPPLARIDSLESRALPARGDGGFTIRETRGGGITTPAIPADVALCDACLQELFDPHNRRYLHPFIACSHCGPRFTITRSLPYDRSNTSMAAFPLCGRCAAEYGDPEDRRFHAEPIGCHDCGPRFPTAFGELARWLEAGEIVALKGIGGFHLVCDARNAAAVARLRDNKRRDGKPFAVMTLNSRSAARYVRCDSAARAALESVERPVVLLPRRNPDRPILAPGLAPGLNTLGVVLPYSAIHYLLFHALLGAPEGVDWLRAAQDPVLVMTSANLSGEPLIIDNAQARAQLTGIADRIADHDREILVRADDSVLFPAPADGSAPPRRVRRARGQVPGAIALAGPGPRVLALGAQLKATVTCTRGDQAWVSQHIGDLDTPAAIAFHRACTEALQALLQTEPERLACDLHPDFASTRLAEKLASRNGLPLVRVQHHHAHVAAVLAEHRHEGPALGVALDGYGIGTDGTAWGGELLHVDGARCRRVGHFAPLRAPGGDRAAREPWRLAAAVLHGLGQGATISARFRDEPLAAPLAQLLDDAEAGNGLPLTTSAARLFDAAASLLGVAHRSRFEGDAPMRLESLVRKPTVLDGGYGLHDGVLDFATLLAHLAETKDPRLGAEHFHGTVLEGLVDWIDAAAEAHGLRTVALAGGCLLNGVLARELPKRLRRLGLTPLSAQALPPNDGGVSLGQAWVARRMDSACTRQPAAHGGHP